ncbi:hypothetical protein PV04_00957 [Phialophora macrospora]|uniref:Transcription factor domain-containing protein n=1 Tax=Phialophora macrospora TaxID=1851006 RepID=A0A0D2EEP8_9EURO|nr:hypothetical protein PV04_00957 [Phialophora macrospora]
MQRRAAHHEPTTPRRVPTDALQRLIHETEVSFLRANRSFSAKPAEFFYSTVLDVFQPRERVGVFSGDRLPSSSAETNFSSVALCIRGLLPFAKPAERQVLDTALFSLLTMYMGRLAKDRGMAEMAGSAYTTAIRDFRHVIGSSFPPEPAAAQMEFCQLFLALSTALQLFEFVNDLGKTGPGFLAHYDAMLKLLQLSGPEVYQSPALLKSFSGIRGIAVFIALERRQDTYLSRTEWIDVPFRQNPKNRRETLHDLALQVPALLAQADDFVVVSLASDSGTKSPETSPDTGHALQQLSVAETLLAAFAKIRSKLEHWLREFTDSSAPKPLYWESNEAFDSTYAVVDTHCIPKHEEASHLLRFQDGQKAGALIIYWGVMLELLMSVVDVQAAVSTTIVTSSPAAAMRAMSLCRDMEANRSAADVVATLMLQSLPYLECCLEGVFVAQLPMRVVHRYFGRLPRPSNRHLPEIGAVDDQQDFATPLQSR